MLNSLFHKKIAGILAFVLVSLYILWPYHHEVVNEGCGLRHEFLAERILLFFTRDTWWDGMLCRDARINQTQSKVLDLIPLRIMYKEVWLKNKSSENIFFLENNCKLTVSFYVQCALESATKLNPSYTIYLLTVTPFLEDGSHAIRNLLDQFPNIQIMQVDYDSILQDIPLETFRSPTRWTKNKGFVKSHMSDAFRIAVLWKEGGVYMDTDIISLKQLPSEDNVVLLEQNNLHSCFLKFNKRHKVLFEIMRFQNSSYDGSWISMGPRPITKGVSSYCNETRIKVGKYKDIRILPFDSFGPVTWDKTVEFLKIPPTSNLSKIIKTSYGFHTSHYMTGDKLNELGKDNLYNQITKEFCPFSYNQHH